MQLYEVNKENRDELISQAIRAIKFGRLVIARADTSYAILGLPGSRRAMDELKRIKNGRGSKYFSIFACNKKSVVEQTPEQFRDLVKKLVPGEVTLVFNKRKPGLRLIRKQTINEIITGVGEPVTATSANPTGETPARVREDMRKYFDKYRVIVLYEGDMPEKLSSTVIDLTANKPKVLRQGTVTLN